MAISPLFESNFEAGTNAEWDDEADTDSALDFPHYTDLARAGQTTYRGAYCMRVRMGGTNDRTLRMDIGDIAEDGTRFLNFHLYLGKDLAFTADDDIHLVHFEESEDTTTGTTLFLRMINSTDAISLALGENETINTTTLYQIKRGRWYNIEVKMKADSQGAGTLDLYVNNSASAISITSVTAAPILDIIFGVTDGLTTTTGTILFDEVKFDDVQVYPYRERRPKVMNIGKTQSIFVGPGHIESAAIITTGNNEVLRLFDTDVANIDDVGSFVTELLDAQFTSVSGPIEFKRGCYAVVAGTALTAQCQVVLLDRGDRPGVFGPQYHSDANIINYGLRKRKARLYGV